MYNPHVCMCIDLLSVKAGNLDRHRKSRSMTRSFGPGGGEDPTKTKTMMTRRLEIYATLVPFRVQRMFIEQMKRTYDPRRENSQLSVISDRLARQEIAKRRGITRALPPASYLYCAFKITSTGVYLGLGFHDIRIVCAKHTN